MNVRGLSWHPAGMCPPNAAMGTHKTALQTGESPGDPGAPGSPTESTSMPDTLMRSTRTNWFAKNVEGLGKHISYPMTFEWHQMFYERV